MDRADVERVARSILTEIKDRIAELSINDQLAVIEEVVQDVDALNDDLLESEMDHGYGSSEGTND